MLSSNARLALDVKIGDHVTVKTPSGDTDFTVCGFGSDDAEYYQGQTYMAAVYMMRDAYISIMEQSRTYRIICWRLAPIQRIIPKNFVRCATLLFILPEIINTPANNTITNKIAAIP